LVIIEKELFPYFPAIFERIFKLLGIKYVADYDDAIFHNYDRSKVLFINFFLRKKIDYVMKHSAAVIAGNNYLAERAIMANAKKVVIIPTVIDARRYLFNPEGQPKSELVIGWIGSPTTLKYLINLKNVFTSLAEKYSFKLHIIGGGSIGLVNNENVIPWSEETEIAELYKIDIGIMPLINSDWERGKCAYKLIQYMACGKPVVASPVGANLNLVSNSETGYFANTDQEWYDALEVLLLNSEARKEMGKKAAEFIRSNYTIQSISLKHLDIFKTVINSNN
jgi:glycosyltransferase involved in cell wall biosynthesis